MRLLLSGLFKVKCSDEKNTVIFLIPFFFLHIYRRVRANNHTELTF